MSEPFQRARPIKRRGTNPSLQPSLHQASTVGTDVRVSTFADIVNPIIKKSINQLLNSFSFYTPKEQSRDNNPTYKERIRNSLYEINQLYVSMYMPRVRNGDFSVKYIRFRNSILRCIEDIGHSIIRSKNISTLTNIGNTSGEGATSEFKKIIGDNKKGYKIIKASQFIQIGKLFIEYFIHKYLNKIQTEKDSEIRERFGYLPIPTIYQMNRLQHNSYSLKINHVLGKSLAKYLQDDFIHFTEEVKLDRLKDILLRLSNILDYFNNKISFTHLDLTPSNIMINESNQLYLIDFRKSVIIPNDRIYTSETICLEYLISINELKSILSTIDLSLFYFTLIQHYYMVLGERCMKYLVDLIFKNGTYDIICEWFKSDILKSPEIQKNAAISSFFYTFMFYSLLKDESDLRNYKRQINKCGEKYTKDIVLKILFKLAVSESGNRGIPVPFINNFMFNIYHSKISVERQSEFMFEIFGYPEHFVCRTLSFRYNFWFLLSSFLKNKFRYDTLGYFYCYVHPNNNYTEPPPSLDELNETFWDSFSISDFEYFIRNPRSGGKKKNKSKIKKTKK